MIVDSDAISDGVKTSCPSCDNEMREITHTVINEVMFIPLKM